MAGTSIYSVYRRTARAAAKQQVVRKTSSIDVDSAYNAMNSLVSSINITKSLFYINQ